jgi:hypothetical protein
MPTEITISAILTPLFVCRGAIPHDGSRSSHTLRATSAAGVRIRVDARAVLPRQFRFLDIVGSLSGLPAAFLCAQRPLFAAYGDF